jgi:large repetitive protein
VVATVALVAAGLAGGSQGVALASARGSGPGTTGAGVSTKWMDAKGGAAPVSATGNAHDVRKAAAAGAGRPSGRPASAPAGALGEWSAPQPAHKVGKSGSPFRGFVAATSTRVASKSSAQETYYANQDGSHTVQLSQSPVNYQDGSGNWQPISTALVAGSGGRLQEQANSVGVSLAPSSAGAPAAVPAALPQTVPSPSPSATAGPGSSQLADLTLGSGESAGWSLAGAAGVTAQVSGATASYPGILPDTTLELTGTATGVKESIVLSGPGAPTSWVFPMDLQGLTLSTDANGDVDLVDSSGSEVATLPQPYASDSASNTAADLPDQTFAMQYQITTYDGGPAVELTLPASYTASALTYPVTVDPTVVESIAGDDQTTYIEYGKTADYSTSDYMLLGSNNSGTNYGVPLLKFPAVPTDDGDHITAATLSLWDEYAANCTAATSFSVLPVASSWTASGSKSWSNMPKTSASIGTWSGDSPSAACANTSYNPQDGASINVPLSTSYLQGIALGQTTDYGFAVTDGSDTNDNYYKEITSDNVTARSPTLSVTYTPDVAPDIEHTWPTAGFQASTLTPELEAQAADPDAWPNPSLTYNFAIYDSTGKQIAASGPISATDWQVPAGDLTWNGTYQWDVSAYDGFDTTTSGLAPLETVTAQPLVASSLAQNGGAGYSPNTGNYTTSATDAQENVAGPQLAVVRSYNSLDGRASDSFGQGWSSVADMRAVADPDGSGSVVITDDTGQESRYGYEKNPTTGAVTYSPPLGTSAIFTAVSGGGYQLIDKQDTTYLFTLADGTGTWLISSITTKAGLAQTFSYGTEGSQTALQTITDQASGRTLTFTWAKQAGAAYYHVATVTTDDASAGDPSTASKWTYQYTGDELSSACPPDETASDTPSGSCANYTYQAGTDYPAAVLDAGPYSYWRLDEPSGSAGAASSVLSNEGADDGGYSSSGVTLGSSSDPGPLAGGTTDAAALSGSSSYVQLPGSLVASSSYQSVALWFKTTSAGVLASYQDGAVSAGATTVKSYTPSLYVGTDGKLNGEFWYSGGANPITSTAAVNNGQWHFAVLTSAGATQSLYLDGALQGTATGAVAPYADGTEHEYLGAGYWGGNWPDEPDQLKDDNTGYADYLNGQIAEAAFFTSPLPATQITQLYNDARQSSAWMTRDVTADGSTAAQVAYDAADGRVSSVTDQDGGTWTLGQPATSGTAAPFASAVLGDGPDGFWRLGDQAGSTLAADEVAGGAGSYNDVTLGGAGPFGASGPTSAAFGGVDSAIEMPSGEFLSSANAETIGLWFNTTHAGQVLASVNSSAVTAGGSSAYYAPVLYVGSDGHLIGGPSPADNVKSAAAVDDGKWHFAVLVLNAAASPAANALYLDGTLVGTAAGTVVGGAGSDDSEIGAGYLGGSWPDEAQSGGAAAAAFFNGSIAEVFHVPAVIGAPGVAALYGAAQASTGQAATEVVNVTDPGGKTLTYRYDLQNGGRILSETDGTGATTSYGYDTGGFLDTVTNPDGDVVTTTHDIRGNVLSKTTCQDLAAGDCSTSYYTYYTAGGDETADPPPDPRNNLMLTSSDGRSSSASDTTYQTTYIYDSLGDELTKTSPPVPGYPDGMTTTSTYTTATTPAWGGGDTPAGLLASTTNADGATTSYNYTSGGDLAEKNSPLGQETTYAYDGLGDVEYESIFYDSAGTCLAPSAGQTYGPCENAGSAVQAETYFGYDPQGRLLTETDPPTTDAVTGTQHTEQTAYTYDADGDVLTTVESDLTGGDPSRTTTNVYNGDDQLSSTTDPAGLTTGYAYDAYGNLATRTDPNGAQYSYTYDADGRRLTETLDNFTGTGPTPSAPAAQLLDTKTYDGDGRLITDTNPVGVTTTDAYYDNGLVEQVTETGTDGSTYTEDQDAYDAAGNLISDVTGNGTLTTGYTVDAADRTTQTTVDPDSQDQVTSVTLNASGQVLTSDETDAAGDTPIQGSYTYDAAGDQLSQTVVASAGTDLTTSATYDTRGVQETSTDEQGNVTDYVTDADGQTTETIEPPVTVTAAGGATSTVTPTTLTGYDTYGDVAEAEDADGDITSYAYDADGEKTGETLPSYTPPDGTGTVTPTDAWTYTPQGQVETATVQQGTAASPVDSTTSYAYDQLGDQVQQTNPDINEWGTMTPGVSTATYNLAGQSLSTTDPYGATAYQSYDGLDRPSVSAEWTWLSATSEGEVSTTDAYNTAGELASATTADGDVTSYAYYADGQLKSQSDTTGNTTSYAYDLLGDTDKTTLPDGSIDTATYDGAGRETGTAQENTSGTVLTSTTATYSPDGNITSSTNADGHTTTFAYDALGDLTQQTEPVSATASIVTQYGYDANGNETAYTDGNGNTSHYTYNSLGLQESATKPATATDPSDNTTTTSYTADGQPAEVQLPGGVVQNYAYDALDDLTAETGSGASAATVCRDYIYDLDQHVVGAGCSSGTGAGWEYPTWNSLGENLGNSGQAGASSFSYTADGQLASRTDASGTSTFTYNSDDLEATDTDALTGTTLSYAYNSLSQPETITYGTGGDVRTFGYNAEHELASDTFSYNGTTLGSVSYGHDNAGQITAETTTGLTNAGTQTFGYDQDGRLTSWTSAPAGGTAATTDYTYDNDGNRLTAGAKTYLYNAEDQLTSDGTSTYAYTDDGDLASVTTDATGATTDYTSDAFGQQISDGTETGTYDAFGRAITQGPATFTYADLGNDLASTTGGPADGSGTTTYSHDANDQLVADGQPGDTSAANLDWTDQHGNVIGFFNDTTTGVAPSGSNAYDPWGNLTSATGHHTDLGYQGEYTDSADGSGSTAVLMGARWYDPSAGEFQNADTDSNSPTPLSVNADSYAYADDSPLDGTDPSGHSIETVMGAGEAAPDAAAPPIDLTGLLNMAGAGATAAFLWLTGSGGSSYTPVDYWSLAVARATSAAAEEDQYLGTWSGNSDAEVREAHALDGSDGYDAGQQGYTGGYAQETVQLRIVAAANLRATQRRAAAIKRAQLAAARRAALLRQLRIDQRDAKATADVGKSALAKGATGSVGGRGGPLSPAKTVAATQDLLADVAGVQASQAGVGGFGPGGGGPGANTADGSCGPEPSDGTLPDPSLLLLQPGNNQNQDTTSGGQSFTGDTKVLLPNGKTAPISSLKPGNKVEAYDTKTGRDQVETVTAVLLHHDTNLYNLTIRSGSRTEVIHTTSSHLFWDPSLKHWVPAAKLKKGEHLNTPNGPTTTTADGGGVPTDHNGWMWDLTVPGNDDHDFYVVANTVAVLVHNSSYQLGCNLRDADEDPNTPNPEAHHIVPEGHPLAASARAILRSLGIGIDSAENGVWLGRATHIGTLANSYVQWINDQIVNAASTGGRSAVLDVLGNTKNTLQALDQNYGNGV